MGQSVQRHDRSRASLWLTTIASALTDWVALRLYIRIARLGNFSATARECGYFQTQASYLVARFEAALEYAFCYFMFVALGAASAMPLMLPFAAAVSGRFLGTITTALQAAIAYPESLIAAGMPDLLAALTRHCDIGNPDSNASNGPLSTTAKR